MTHCDVYDGLSCPHAGLNPDLIEMVVVDHASEVLQLFVEKYRSSLQTASPELLRYLDTFDSDILNATHAWDTAFGDMHAQLVGGPSNPVAAAAKVAVRIASAGHSGCWTVDLAAPVELRLGTWLLPPIRQLSFEANRGEIVLTDREIGETYRFSGAECSGSRKRKPQQLAQVHTSHLSFGLLGTNAVSPDAARRLLNADAYSFDGDARGRIDSWASVCRQAMEIVETTAPEYVPWIATVVKDLVPLEGKPGLFNSGSERFSPGIVCLSDHDFAWMVAEILVHEATHHYLHIASRIGAIDDGSDTALHFSPFRNKDRPIFYIVAAYHAFANVLLFYRSARARGFVPDTPDAFAALRNREDVLARQLAVIEPTLIANRALTPLGRSLWHPLYEAVHA